MENIDGQHWTVIQERWMKKDREQCESWKDEVQYVLIFSGSFSTIATGFIIVAQQHLRPDPVVELLRQIAAQYANNCNCITQSEVKNNHAIAICMNVFLFLSLVLNLMAALVGIVSLQWIRVHIHILRDGPEALGLSHMHSLGLQKSYIPFIFNSLPIILIFSFILFLAGFLMFTFELSWQVAIPVAIGIAFIIAFLLTTTTHPGLQRLPVSRPSNKPTAYPSLYRSPQSLLFLKFVTFLKRFICGVQLEGQDDPVDWTSRSRIWLQQRQNDFSAQENQLPHHLNSMLERLGLISYDTIQTLLWAKERASVPTERDRTLLAKCLAQVLPFLPASRYVPTILLLEEPATIENLNSVAFYEIASGNGLHSGRSSAIIESCLHITHWLFERPRAFDSISNKQPLHLISHLDNYSPHVYEVLLNVLVRFFTFAATFQPDSECINKTTFTSSYTFWFLVLSAQMLTKRPLSNAMQMRHSDLLTVIATRLHEQNCDYLFLTASIYASIISRSSEMHSPPFGGGFLHAVIQYHELLEGKLKDPTFEQLFQAVKACDISWNNIHHGLQVLGA